MFEYIVAILFGAFLGNFGTTVLYRSPRGISIAAFNDNNNEYKPFCSICHHPLKFYEYLPLISWISTLGKCRYCYKHIDKSYWLLETLSAFWSLMCYIFYGFSDIYIIVTFAGIIALTQIFIYIIHGNLDKRMSYFTLALGMLYTTSQHMSVMLMFAALSFSCIICMLVMNATKRHNNITLLMTANLVIWLLKPNFLIAGAIIIIGVVIYCGSFRVSALEYGKKSDDAD